MKIIDHEIIKAIHKIDNTFNNVQKGMLTNESLSELRKCLADVIGYFEEKYLTIEDALSKIGNGRDKN